MRNAHQPDQSNTPGRTGTPLQPGTRAQAGPRRKGAGLALAMVAAAALLACGGGGGGETAADAANRKAAALLAQMTQAEKIQLVHGTGFPADGASLIPGIPRLGIPDIRSVDSASGMSLKGRNTTALPSTLALAASWDVALSADYGTLLAKEIRTMGFAEGLGGGLNLAREPRNGRTFEYLGEDPVLAGEMVAARTQGTQSQKVIATIKHFALNGQETNRFTSNSIVDERTMRELYLLGFEIATLKGQPGNVMCAYNLVNGEKACESPTLLNQILKKEWGFDGVVQTDWLFALTDTVRGANAGLDEEQPGSNDDSVAGPFGTSSHFNQKLRDAIAAGTVAQSRLDDMVLRKLRVLYRVGLMDAPPPTAGSIDIVAGDAMALRTAQQAMVLLKNDSAAGDSTGVLPLHNTAGQNIVVIGGHANRGVMGGGGSGSVLARGGDAVDCRTPGAVDPFLNAVSLCAPWYRSSPLDALRARLPGANITYLDGADAAAAAVAAASADVALVFATQFTTEQVDLPNLSLPDATTDPANQAYDQNALIATVAAAARRTVVVLETGTAVTMPWLANVHAVLEAWYPGSQGGEAIASILVGETNPSGKLPLSFPRTEADLPQKRISATELDVHYTEGLQMGYRWYDARNIEPLFAFGHGLSYTSFAYSGLNVSSAANGDVTAVFNLRNTGTRSGAEVAQAYVGLPAAAGAPPQRLVAWQKVSLAPGESRQITLTIPAARFAIWSGGWTVPAGDASVSIGGSSRDMNALKAPVRLQARSLAHAV